MLKRPLTGVYLSFFLMVTLMILVSATWMGLYLAKRITRPVQLLAAAAREIGAGHLDHRIEPETADEFGSLVEAFNTMAGELAGEPAPARAVARWTSSASTSRSRSGGATSRPILERIATGVISVDAGGRIEHDQRARRARLLGLDRAVDRASRRATCFARADLQPLGALLATRRRRAAASRPAQEIALVRDGREVHLAVAATPLPGDGRQPEGAVLVLDDVTPLIRAQKVAAWREVARRLAHEIKNPLTPIQLCAERLQRHFAGAPEPARALVDECTGDDRRRGRVAEGAGRRVLAVRADAGAARGADRPARSCSPSTLALYDGLFTRRAHRARCSPRRCRRCASTPSRSAAWSSTSSTTPSRRSNQQGPDRRSRRSTTRRHGVVRIVVADDGPGIPPEERDKLFMPYFSTKKRGSGLGLAIVRRIVAEHGGTIEVGANEPRGTRFTIELPCQERT